MEPLTEEDRKVIAEALANHGHQLVQYASYAKSAGVDINGKPYTPEAIVEFKRRGDEALALAKRFK